MSFTLSHAVVASLFIHGALVLPFVLPPVATPPEDPPILVVELQGLDAPMQSEERVQKQTKGEGAPREAQAAAPETPPPQEASQPEQPPETEEPPEEVVEDGTPQKAEDPSAEPQQSEPVPQQTQPSEPVAASAGASGAANVEGDLAQQKAQTIAQEQQEAERLRAYVRALVKKVQDNLVYPDSGRRKGLKGEASIGVSLQADGSIVPGSLRVVASSGQPQLDASALKTVEGSAPFAPPPRAITIAIAVVYGKLAKDRK
ncbi:TonB family protein [Hyphomicrobium sp. D-2]|uniref:TonB family protein n=1 Tax=Hyphomicrobium sp. D-2 TaxID=3041621 RepID=UPI00245846C0|nr:TonB family protein [Hyphomicrobium sp. D-2]MDH4982416.1 TonB family protein [Hyphomicrobium sp. D-2]